MNLWFNLDLYMYYILQVELKEKLLQKPKGMLMIIYYFSLITIFAVSDLQTCSWILWFFCFFGGIFFLIYVHVMNKKNVGFLLIWCKGSCELLSSLHLSLYSKPSGKLEQKSVGMDISLKCLYFFLSEIHKRSKGLPYHFQYIKGRDGQNGANTENVECSFVLLYHVQSNLF